MKTALSNCTVKSKRGFLQALVLLVLVPVGILSQPALAQTTPLAPCTLTDIDRDDDGLIEICDLEGLSAIRHQLDGSGYKASGSATKITAGCAEGGCKGYELDKNLDFNDDASYSSTPNKVIWTTGSGWQPIGYSANNKSFKATFKGNGYTISNLMINRLTIDGIGLFGYTHSAEIINIALLDVDIQGYENVGGLVGSNYQGTITNSYATGSVKGEGRVGGLVGYFYNSNITDSYATSSADGNDGVGGLVGYLYNGNITDSYAAGAVEGDRWAGGLVGYSGSNSSDYSSITNSYATGAVSGTRWVGGLVGYFYNGNITDSYATDSVEGDDGIGGLVGYFYNSNITYSYATGAASGTRWVGGLVGYSGSDSRITNSYATGAVEGEGRAGGLVGYFYNGNITDSYAMGSVSGTRWIGGLVGSQLTSNITNSYATGSVSGIRWLGGLVSDSQGGSITNSYWDWASRILSSDGGVGKTTTELQSPTTATGIYSRWSTNNWDFGTSEQYPALKYSDGTLMPNQVRERAEEPEQIPQIEIASLTSCGTVDIDQDDDGLIEICDLEGLNAIRYQVDGSGYRASESAVRITAGCPEGECIGYELNNDLDFDNDASYSSTSNKVIWTTGLGWQPIETYYHPFNTTFKANKYSISNLMIARPSLSQVGLFGNIGSRARIEDVSLIDVDIRGDKRVGGLAGISRGTITTSYVMGVVRGEDSIGGLVGDNHGLISNSYTNVEMLGGKWGVGGIAGMNRGTITTSYVIGVVRGNASVGGLVGDNHGLIINNYTHAEMSGDAYVGGLVGCNFSGGAVTNSYTVPQISRDFSNAGGLVGYSSSNGLLVRSYWDKDVSGISSGDHGVGLTTEELQSPITSGSTSTEIYYGWSTDIWDFGTSEQYPVFNRDSTFPSVEIAVVPAGAVNEGEQITLTASPHNSDNNILPSYSWTQTSGKTLLTSPTSGSSVTLNVPEDYVVASDNTANVVLILEASNDVGSTAQQVLITITKRNNGRIAALGVPTLNERELTAPSIDLSGDPDGVGSNIRYQWQFRQSTQTAWVKVPAAGTNALYTIPADTAGIVQYRVVVSYTDGQGYEEQLASEASSYRGNTIPSVEIAGVPAGAVNEGEQITLTASPHNSDNNILPSYSWTQTSGKTLLTSPTSRSSVTLDVPADYVVASDNTANVVLILEASNDVGSTAQQVLITITKLNNGRIAALGFPTLNERELTAPSIDLSGDPDGSGSNIRYQWQIRQSTQTAWVNVPAAGTNERYIIPADTAGIVQFRVVVSYTDGQGYEEQLASEASSYRGNTIPSVEIAVVPAGAVNEGEQITLTASPHNSDNNILPSYSWTQTSGKTLLTSPTSRSSVTLDVPADYVVASDNTANVVLILEASNDVGSTAQQVLITITKLNNGRIAALGELTRNERELTAPSIDLSGDPDGSGSNIRYQWQIRQSTQTAWVNVPAAGTNALYTIPADTAGIVQYRVVVSYTDGQGYEEQLASRASSYRGNTIPSVEIAVVPAGAVDEGEQITLTASPHNSDNNILPSYSWTQTSGKTLLTSPTSGSSVTLDVPADYVVASDNTANVVLILEASNDVGSTAQQVLITIAKRNNGRIAALGFPTRNERELTAPSIDLSGDPDGGVSNIRYQWQSRQSAQAEWVDVPAAGTNERYTIPADTTGIVQYRVVVNYTDGQNYEEQVESEALNYISIEIAGVRAVNEGEQITLMAPASVPLTYHWQQTSGKTLLTSPTSGSSVTLDVPADYVVASDNTANVVLMLEASNDVGSTAQQVLITITKLNNGVAALGELTRNERELTAPPIDLSGDPDGSGSNIRYQWQIRQSAQAEWVDVPAAGTNALYTIPADTTGIVQYRVMVSYTDGQGYEEQLVSGASNYISIEIAVVPSGAVNEGEQITLTASPHNSDNNILPSYSWTQTSGKTLLTSPTSGSSVTLNVPEDYVVASASTSNLVITLEASNDIDRTAQQVLITITKLNNGVAELGEPTLNEGELTAPPIDLSGDPDGSGSNIRYQWQIRQSTQTAWVNVPATGTNERYIIPADITGIVQFRVVVSYTDGQGYEEQLASEALSYRGNTSPSIELPVSGSSISLLVGQTTEVSVVISEVDLRDVVTLVVESTPTIGIIDVEPSRIVLEASLSERRTTQFQLTAEQIGSTKLLLTAIDDSQTATDRSSTVELTIEIEAIPFTPCGYADIDRDDDGLIEICYLEGLNAIRHQLDGSGYQETILAPEITTGCGEGVCKGYELDKDLDFNDDASYSSTPNKVIWTTGEGWQPIGDRRVGFSSIFEGNNNTISNLMIDGSLAENVGLFGVIDGPSEINGIGLLDVDINAETLEVGGLAGRSSGNITNSYVTGNVTGLFTVGGLVGHCSSCSISNSYVIGSVEAIASEFVFETANIATGGLVGFLRSSNSNISRSHAIGSVKGVDGYAGGLIGNVTGANGSIMTSYAFVDVEGGSSYTGGLVGINSGTNNEISNSYSIGKVVGEIAVGGLVGNNSRTSNPITNSYSFSSVRGTSQVGGLVGNNAGTITNSYATGSVAGDVDQTNIGGLGGAGNAGGTTNSYWDRTTSGQTTSVGGVSGTTADLQSPTTSTGIYSSWSGEIWDFGTSEQYPALKYSDGTLIPGQRIGLLSLSVLTTEALPITFNTEVFDYRLLIASEADSVQLLPTATHPDANINIVSGSDFSESVASGSLSPEISLNTTSTTITIEVEFDSGASRSYRITISLAGQSAPAQMAEINTPFEYTIPIGILMDANNNMNNYEVTSMPSWLSQTELQAGLMFSGTPGIDHIGDSSEQMIEIQIDNGDGIIQTLNLMLQIDSPTTGTVTLRELEGGILQLDNELRDDNGIEEVTYIWEHCPVGTNVCSELEGVDGMSYAIPQEVPYMGFGTAYRVRTTVVDGLGQRSEYTTQIELQSIFVPEPVIRIRAKMFLEGFLQ